MITSVLMRSNPLSLSLSVNATFPYPLQPSTQKPLKDDDPPYHLIGAATVWYIGAFIALEERHVHDT